MSKQTTHKQHKQKITKKKTEKKIPKKNNKQTTQTNKQTTQTNKQTNKQHKQTNKQTTQTNKQTNKQTTQTNNTNKHTNKQTITATIAAQIPARIHLTTNHHNSNSMGNCSASPEDMTEVERAQKRQEKIHSDELDRDLVKRIREDNNVLKVLVLGQATILCALLCCVPLNV